jgi:hypothetical protein
VSGGAAVFIKSDGQLGTSTSSVRFKDQIKPMEKESESILALKPVTFRYKKEIDPQRIPQWGLVAEDVERVNPDLVVHDQAGTPYSVRYEQVNAMLLNEFLKEHRKVEKQQAIISELKSSLAILKNDFGVTAAKQRKEIQALTTGLQKVSEQVGVSTLAVKLTATE